MRTIRPLSALAALREQAVERAIIDFGASRTREAQIQVRLESADWNYVGDPGQPAFENNWKNARIDQEDVQGPGIPVEDYRDEVRNHVAFFRDRWGTVHLQGVVDNPVSNSTSAMFTLPTEMRPEKDYYFTTVYKTFQTGFPPPGPDQDDPRDPLVSYNSTMVVESSTGRIWPTYYSGPSVSPVYGTPMQVRNYIMDGFSWVAWNVGQAPV